MKKLFALTILVFGILVGCGEKKPSAEEIDHQMAMKIDSMATDLGQSADQLLTETDQLDKDADELLKELN